MWRDALGQDDGVDLGAEGITSSMDYWADVLYETLVLAMAEHENTNSVIVKEDSDIDMGWRDEMGGSGKQWAETTVPH